ncbi:FimV/HubP family polar landmark protein [Shewanella aestuarii]|uniref:LysM domain-containing protein n=1 Tax=Shewanella aestuarii TaxID=1028752 RepID=A0A6G9QFP4_9GAMM|nr:FimV/HubP family polar landmark protein [Shewanella aestuarii]QIR13354.1 hypothetical protein HBH39_01640 [Shewanella aestuarii]
MKAFQVCFALASFAMGALSSSVNADVSHIGIETMDFEAGELPKLNVNVVSDHNDLTLLSFYIRQKYKNTVVLEKLLVDDHKQNTFILRGQEKIIDPNSTLIVSEFREGKWQQYSPVTLFNKKFTVQNDGTQASMPVAIKTLKSSPAYKQRYQATAKEAANQPSYSSSQSYFDDKASNHPKNQTYPQANYACAINKSSEDTLWTVASNHAKKWGTNVFGAMLAIYEANPQAFVKNNIQKLKSDSQLNCPTEDVLAQYQDANQDKAKFDAVVAGETLTSITYAEHDGLVQTDDDMTMSVESSELESQVADIEYVEELIEDSQQQTAAVTALTEQQVMNEVDNPINSSSEVDTAVNDNAELAIHIPDEAEVPDVAADDIESIAYSSEACEINKLPDDSLWRIAMRKHEQWQTNVFGAMLAIYDANPNAFANGQIIKLRADSNLVCPSKDILQQYDSLQADKQKFDDLVNRSQQG